MNDLEAKLAKVEVKLDRILAHLESNQPQAVAPPESPAPDITPAELARLRHRHGKSVINDFNRRETTR